MAAGQCILCLYELNEITMQQQCASCYTNYLYNQYIQFIVE